MTLAIGALAVGIYLPPMLADALHRAASMLGG
jgi:hypothetical protein